MPPIFVSKRWFSRRIPMSYSFGLFAKRPEPLALFIGAAFSLTGVTTSAQSDESALQLEEVIVTARKREASLQDVSIAVTALSDSMLGDAHIQDAADLTQLVPARQLVLII
jgi:outer membrane receptor protein involved in Fe transport